MKTVILTWVGILVLLVGTLYLAHERNTQDSLRQPASSQPSTAPVAAPAAPTAAESAPANH